MDQVKDYYEILEIRKNASYDEIRKAYRRLAFKFHPDRSDNVYALEIFKEINEAKHILLNEEKKKEYDSLFIKKKYGLLFFETGKTSRIQINGLKKNTFRPDIIRQNKRRNIVLLCCLSALFVFGLTFLLLPEEKQPVHIVRIYKETNKDDTIDFKENIEKIAAEKDSTDSVKKIIDSANSFAKVKEPYKKVQNTAPVISKPDAAKAIAKTSIIDKKQEKQIVKNVEISPFDGVSKKEKVEENQETKKVTKLLTLKEMNNIVKNINLERVKYVNPSLCIQIRKTVNSNVSNAFKLANLLKKKGFTISGRETAFENVARVKINAKEGCVKVTIGTF